MSCDNDWLPWSLSNTGHAFFLGVVAANVYLDLLVEQGVVAVLDYPGFGWDRGMGLYLGRPCSLNSYGGLSGLSGLSGLICNENLAKNCPQLDRIFFGFRSWSTSRSTYYSVGNVDGQAVRGENVVSSVSHPVSTICVTKI